MAREKYIAVLSHEISQLYGNFPIKSKGREIPVPNQFSAPPDVHCFFLASTSQPYTFVPSLSKGMWKGSLRAIYNSFIIAYSMCLSTSTESFLFVVVSLAVFLTIPSRHLASDQPRCGKGLSV